MNILLPTTVVGLLVTGMGLALLGSVKVPLARKLGIDEARVGGLVSLFGFAMIPVILTAGFLTDLLGKPLVWTAGAALMAAGLMILARSRTYAAALLAVVLLSAAWSAQINVINVVTPVAFGGSKAFAINLGNVFFGVGAFLTPLGVAVLVRKAGFEWGLFALAVIVGLSAVLPLSLDAAQLAKQTSGGVAGAEAVPGFRTLLEDRVMWLCALALFFYGPMEGAMAAWATTYLGETGVGEETASGLLSGFWLAFMASRLITAFSLPEGWEAQWIFGLGVLSAGVLGGVAFGRGRSTAVAMVIAAGLVFGPVFPTIMAILLGHFDSAVHGRAVGLLFAIGGIGWTTIPLLIGASARKSSVQRSFRILIASALALCVVASALIYNR